MPELTPEQKAQLDKNIRSMLSQGASQDDVTNYANDFKLKYDTELKKKRFCIRWRGKYYRLQWPFRWPFREIRNSRK